MKVIPPLALTDAMVTSSTVSEPDTGETAWNAGHAYAVGDRAYLASNHTIYERLIAGTTATSPDQDTANWASIGPTNKWRMFDLLRNTGTTGPSPLTVVITPGTRVNSIALVGLVADQVEITMTNGGETVYSVTEPLSDREVVDWYDYFFDPFTTTPDIAHFDLPPYTAGVITVTITRATGDVTCGGVLLGTAVDLGETVHDAVSDVLNFSTIERDEFGNSTLVQRRNVPKINVSVVCDVGAVNKIRAVRDQLNATPAFWSWLDDQDDAKFDAGVILGIYTQFTIALDQPATATITLALEEV